MSSYIIIDGVRVSGTAAATVSMQIAVHAALDRIHADGLEDLWIPLVGRTDGARVAQMVRLRRDSAVVAEVVADETTADSFFDRMSDKHRAFMEAYGPSAEHAVHQHIDASREG